MTENSNLAKQSGLCLHVKWLLNSMCQKGQFVSGGHNPEQTILQKTASVVINHGNTSAYLA